jgi:hypothetical protein
MELQIFNHNSKYATPALIEPTQLGYVYVAAAVRPAPFILPSAKRSALLQRLKDLAGQMENDKRVIKMSVFRAVAQPPTIRGSDYLKKRAAASMQVANFDVMVLIQTTSPDTAMEVQKTMKCAEIVDAMKSQARNVYMMTGYNVKRIASFDITKKGLYLFNHFAADDSGVMFKLWEYLADWYVKETGLTNSVAMAPMEGEPSDYEIVNWAKWDSGMLPHFWSQLSKKTFYNYVTVNLEKNNAGSMPIYCRLA